MHFLPFYCNKSSVYLKSSIKNETNENLPVYFQKIIYLISQSKLALNAMSKRRN